MIFATSTIEVVGAIAAVVAAILAFLALFLRFRPHFDAAFDENYQAIRLEVKNRGRKVGRVNEVAVVDPTGNEWPADFAGLPEEKFHSGQIDSGVTRKLVIRAREADGSFTSDARLYVSWGILRWEFMRGWRRRHLKPIQPKAGTGSFYPETSDWPPNS